MSLRTIPAVRQVIYAALTSPAITYQVGWGGATNTLTDANVSPRPIWYSAVGGQPLTISPYIAFTIGGKAHMELLSERKLELKIWVSSTESDSDIEELYEQGIRARLHGADLEAIAEGLQMPPEPLTREQTDSLLGLTVRRCRETLVLPSDFSKDDGRWYLSARYELIAL